MRFGDALGIALRTALSKRNAVSVLGIAATVFCLCFAVAGLTQVLQGRAAPCELTVTAGQAKLTSSSVTQMEQVPGVVAATPLVQIPVRLTSGNYAAELTVTGLRGAYVEQKFREGTLFTGHGAMPYLVLNEAACKQFQKNTIDFTDKEPDIHWLGTGMILGLDEANSVPARVCGILASETPDDPPTVLMDYETAQALLRSMGQPADPQQIDVRVRNSGAAQLVTDAISKLGYVATQPDEGIAAEAAWAAGQKEANYLVLLGLLSLLLAVFQMRGARNLAFCRAQGMLAALKWMGLRQGTLRRVLRLQTLLVALLGCAAGLVALAIPALLQQDVVENTCFALTVPADIALPVIAVSAALFTVGARPPAYPGC